MTQNAIIPESSKDIVYTNNMIMTINGGQQYRKVRKKVDSLRRKYLEKRLDEPRLGFVSGDSKSEGFLSCLAAVFNIKFLIYANGMAFDGSG
jgi:hypothetical protein